MTKLQYPLCGPQVCLQRAACLTCLWYTFQPPTRRYVPEESAVYSPAMIPSNVLRLSGLSSSSEQGVNGDDYAAVVMQGDKIGEAQRQCLYRTEVSCFKRYSTVYLFGSCSFSTQKTKTLSYLKKTFISKRYRFHTAVL
jgi:hypothetical protein